MIPLAVLEPKKVGACGRVVEWCTGSGRRLPGSEKVPTDGGGEEVGRRCVVCVRACMCVRACVRDFSQGENCC